MAYVVTANWTAEPGNEHEVAELFAELTAASGAEPGCRVYQPHRAEGDPRRFFLYEVYDDRAPFDRHVESEHFQRLVLGRAASLLERRERAFFTTLDV